MLPEHAGVAAHSAVRTAEGQLPEKILSQRQGLRVERLLALQPLHDIPAARLLKRLLIRVEAEQIGVGLPVLRSPGAHGDFPGLIAVSASAVRL